MFQRKRKANNDEPEFESEEDNDSDRELQVAFQKGYLKDLVIESYNPVRTRINNKIGLTNALESLKSSLLWHERLDVTTVRPVILNEKKQDGNARSEDVDNDFQLELSFYKQAQSSVLEGLKKLQSVDIPTKRPTDYFAEMIKSDEHMKKVKENLLSLHAMKEKSEIAKKNREARKFKKEAKKLGKIEKKHQKQETNSILKKQLNKKNQQNSLDGPVKKANSKRIMKNKKFGFGGQKKRSKSNTIESLDNFENSFKSKQQGKGKKFNKKSNSNY